jgi:hypothetical protein
MTFRFPRAADTLPGIFGLALSLASVPARAESPLELAWDAPAECPTGTVVLNRVRSLAGESLRGSRLRAAGHIERMNGRYRLTLTLRHGGDVRERTMESTSCDDLAGAAAVTLGLLLRAEPTQTGKAGSATANAGAASNSATGGTQNSANETTKSNDSSSTAALKPPPVRAREGTPASSPAEAVVGRRRWNVILRAPFGTLGVGMLPTATFALGAGLGLRYDEWHFMTMGRIFEDATLRSKDLPEIGSSVARAAVDLWACREWRIERVEFGPCVILALSFIRARGEGSHVEPQAQHALVFAPGAGGEGRVFLEPWLAAFGAATLAVATSRPSLLIDEFGEVQRLGPLELALAFGAEWIF